MVNFLRAILANAHSRVSRLFVSLSQQPSSTKPTPCQQLLDEDIYKNQDYHPVSLGDTFDSKRYTVLRKLGYGRYSTVWLANDLKHQRYVALKLLRAGCYNSSHPVFEREILEKIRDVSRESSHEGRKHVLPLNEHFNHRGPNGDHVCLTFDVLGHHLNLQAINYEDGRLPVKAVREIVTQLLKGLDFLHRECGVIHTDLKGQNILLELETPNDTVLDYLQSVPPRTIKGQDGRLVPLQEDIKMPPVAEMASLHIRIIDFGVSSWREKHLFEKIQPLALRAPEVAIGAPWDTGVDIWTLGCLKWATWTDEDEHLARIIEVLGPFPSSLLRKGRLSAEFFHETVITAPNCHSDALLNADRFHSPGKLIRGPSYTRSSLECILNGKVSPHNKPSGMLENEFAIFVDFLKGMLEIDPMKRKSAAQLLQHEWLS
ncbi:hypothetical protein E4U57_000684 [Claviceps arundinis]|uniref:non-specific serine/threonine protein kinase n=1 Tax=Claviceps arundinis TaxID=1623583 RepID=A0ABQ7PLZ4_9HYPO|nr:hypothetical protein E4U57_000684 [Claviceps arundinis]